MLATQKLHDEPSAKAVATPRLWPWCLFGFLFVFVGLALFCRIAYFNDREVSSTRLWHFYLAIIRDLPADLTAGPRFDKLLIATLVFSIHLMGSTFAGIVAVIAVALVRRRTRSA